MNSFKKFLVPLFLILGIVLVVVIFLSKINNLKEKIGIYDNNFKALNLELDETKDYAIAYKFSAEQLEYINDSVIKELNTARKNLDIKDKELKQLQNIKTEIHIIDSIIVKDTIFKETFAVLDTTIGDKWYTSKLRLEYPNKVSLDLKYRSDINVIASYQKEIIGTPKKCFIGRWFQKKQRVIRVDVKDNNPYSEIKSKKFVIIE